MIFESEKILDPSIIQDFAILIKSYRFTIFLNDTSYNNGERCLKNLLKEIKLLDRDFTDTFHNNKPITFEEAIEKIMNLAETYRFVKVEVKYDLYRDHYILKFFKETSKDRPEIFSFLLFSIGGI